jgi:fermentation-respiration switch protein FrsA (DUF1100 family)
MDKIKLRRLLVGDLSVKRVFKSLLFIYASVMLFASACANSMIFKPQPAGYLDGPDIIKLTTSDGRNICAVHIVNTNAAFTVLFSHGNAEDIGHLKPFLEDYSRRGFSILAYDYHGYGASEGRPTTGNTYMDAEAAYMHLVEKAGVPANRIIAHGRSVGGGPAVELAVNHKLAGLIMESSFVSAFRVLTRIPLLPFDKYRNLSKIARVDCPVLVIHGRQDMTIPFWHGEKLFAAAREPKTNCWVEGASHNDLEWVAGERYWQAVIALAETAKGSQKTKP